MILRSLPLPNVSVKPSGSVARCSETSSRRLVATRNADTTMYTDYYLSLRDKGAMVQLNIKLIDRHRKEWLQQYKTFDRFNREFEVSQAMLDELVAQGTSMGITYNEAQFRTALPLIKTQLKALLARDIWDMNEYFQVINTLNDSMKKAIELLRKPGMNFPKR